MIKKEFLRKTFGCRSRSNKKCSWDAGGSGEKRKEVGLCRRSRSS